jgi:peptidoglycan hydrolase-like protein with peptidoglycan-binding domain
MAQIAALSGGTTTTTTTTTSMGAYTFTRSLTVGSEGADVTALQTYLIGAGFSIPAGATGYFGSQTQAAVAAWQTANMVAPAAGYFGPISQAKYMALMATVVPPVVVPPTTGGTTTTPTTPADLQGEGQLDVFEMDDTSDSDISEGAEDEVIAEITAEASDGDIELDRISFTIVGQSTPTESDPWDVFDTITLWVDDEMVAEFDAADKDSYLGDEDNGEFRFSDLGLVLLEDESVEILVGATVAGSVDGAGSDAAWRLTATDVRYFDADGVASDDDTTDELPTATADFDIVQTGDDDDLDLRSSSDDPDSSTLEIDADDQVEHLIFAFDLDASDSDNDVLLNDLTIDATVGSGTLDQLVSDFRMEIEGTSVKAESYTGSGTTSSIMFDFDGKDVEIPAEGEVTVMVYAEFEDVGDSFISATITAMVTGGTSGDIDAEGADDITTIGGSASVNSEVHTLRSQGINVTQKSDTAEAQTIDGSDNDFGEYEMEVEVTAFGEDAYIANTGTAAFTYQIENQAGTVVATGTATSSTISATDADTQGNFYLVEEGTSETFTLRVTYDPLSSGEGLDYRVQFLTIIFNDDADTVTPSSETLAPASTYETDYARISD